MFRSRPSFRTDRLLRHALEAPRSHWLVRAPLWFVVGALLALLALPRWIGSRIEGVRTEMEEVVDPARGAANDMEYALAQQMSLLRGYLLTRDGNFLRRYERALNEENESAARLASLADRVSPRTGERFREFHAVANRWHQSIASPDLLRTHVNSGALLASLPLEQERYERALDAGDRLDSAVVAAARNRGVRVRDLEQLDEDVTTVLAIVALAAAALVGWLGHRLRLLGVAAEQGRVEAQRAMESKARLIRGVTHDLKNPLGAVDGYAELLEMGVRGPLAPEQLEMVGRMRGAVRSVLDALADLLEFSRAEAGLLPVSHQPTEMSPLVQEVTGEHRASAEAAGLSLRVRPAEDLPPVYTDGRRTREVLNNLLSNAIKYTPAGGMVEVTTCLAADGDAPRPGRWAAVAVRDTGPGIPAEDRERIFEEFVRLPSTPSRSGGSGVGLAFSRHLVRLLNGEITVESEVGVGSVFTLWLPLRADGST